MSFIKEEKKKALSPSDIFDIAKKTCSVLKYPDLSNFKNIDEIFEEGSSLYQQLKPDYPFDDNTCILLYMSKPNFGHWCTINRYKTHYDFLDPYGTIIDDQLDHINPDFREESNQERAHLCRLLTKTKKPVHYNDTQLQILDGSTSTCGRYAALFLKFNQVPVERFAQLLIKGAQKGKMTVDDLVTVMSI